MPHLLKTDTPVGIHPTAIVEPSAKIADTATVGPYAVIGPDVTIGEGTVIFSHAVIEESAVIGKNCRIHYGAVIGNAPQDLKYKGEKTWVHIGDNNIIREYATINRGTKQERGIGETRIGNNNLIMSYAHIAHDCIIGDGAIIANNGTLAGHVQIGDRAIVGGLSAVHQFCRVGRLAILGGGFRCAKDIPPFLMAAHEPLKLTGLNNVGLKRSEISQRTRRELREAYRILFRSGKNMTEALKAASGRQWGQEVTELIEFIRTSERGVYR